MNPEPKQEVVVRFAPSPTGPFGIGNARTALFNWLFAKHNGGKFLLRIEDTDKERSDPKYEKEILEGLEWLGLKWDGEIYRQSERGEIYEKYLNKLIAEEKAYYCFCTQEKLEGDREAQLAQGLPPKYSGRCREFSKAETQERVNQGEKAVIRFKMPEGEITFNDLVRKKVKFNGSLMGDIVIALVRPDESKTMSNQGSRAKNFRPLYNFAVVVDDHEMGITHVIRGEDHISNTPKQIAIQKMLGINEPKYAHLPLILGSDKKKLSKRFSDSSFLDYKKEGYLPEAVLNFLILLGWHPKEDKEIIEIKEAIKTFSLQRVQKGGAVLNPEKLDWLNGYYIRNLDAETLSSYLANFIPKQWLKNKKTLKLAIEAEKERLKKLTDFREMASFFFELPDYDGELLIWKDEKEKSKDNLKKINDFLEKLSDDEFNRAEIEKNIIALAEKSGSRGEVYWPFRVALSGKKASPGGPEIAEVLGKEETLRRVGIALEKLQ